MKINKKLRLITTAFVVANIGYAANKRTPFEELGSSLMKENQKQKSLQKEINEWILKSDETLFNDIGNVLMKKFSVSKVDFLKLGQMLFPGHKEERFLNVRNLYN